MQAIYNADNFFWNVYVGQPSGVHDNGQFKMSNVYK
jgi:hypothetical protein